MVSNISHPDFYDFLLGLNNNNVEYILVGGYSVILYGYPRTTGDIDLWVKKSKENYEKLLKAFQEFAMPVFDMTEENFLNNKDINVFTFGRQPVAIDIMTACKGLEFEEASKNSEDKEVDGITLKLISYQDLIKAKKASNRSKDQNDIENLKKLIKNRF